MSWPHYFKDRLILGNPNSDSAIATLWTPMNVVAQMADMSNVAIVGQLYTKRGINYLLRNVLLNPRIKRIFLTGADLMGAGEELIQLASRGRSSDSDSDSEFTSKGRTFPGKVRPYQTDRVDWLDENISEDALKDFCLQVQIINKIGPVSKREVNTFVNESNETNPWAEKRAFLEPEATGSEGLPSEETLFTVRDEKVWKTWIRLLHQIMRFGRPSPMIHHYGSERITEIMNLGAVVYSEDPKVPDLPPWFPYRKSDVDRYVKEFLKASRGDEAYTYGERLKAYPLDGFMSKFLKGRSLPYGKDRPLHARKKILNQQVILAEKLKSFPENKGAIAVLWEPIIDNFGLREVWRTPCLVLVQTMIRDKKLFLTAYFRSNDMYGGWPLNMFGLRAFQEELREQVDKTLKLGPLTSISHSAHLYENNWQLAEKLVHDHWIDVSCQWDPRGNLNLEIVGKEIVVKHLSPDGVFLDEYRQDGTKERAARDLCFKLESAGVFSTIGGAMYAARNIERAETAIKLGLKFTSDAPLNFRKVRP